MFKLMVADDNPFALRELCNFIDWEDFDLSITGTFSNGKSLLDAAKVNMPDVIITDISMPIMDGITLSSTIRTMSSSVKIIFISSYADFVYAQKALSMQISGYILKPFSSDQLTQLMSHVLEELRQERFLRFERERTQRQVDLLRNIAVENYISELMYYPKENDLVCMQLKELNLELFPVYDLQVACIDLSDSAGNVHTDIMHTIRSIIGGYQQQHYRIIAIPTDVLRVTFLLILNSTAPDTADLLSQLCIDIEAMLCLSTSVGYSNLSNDFAKLPDLFHQAKIAVQSSKGTAIMGYEDVPSETALSSPGTAENDPVNTASETKKYSSTSIKKHVRKMKEYIKEHYTEPITTHDVSAAAYLSSSYANHCFNLECGCSIFDYITQNRIQEAKRLLTETDEQITMISELVGYNGKTNFYLAFKKNVGMSPALYRRTHQE